MKFMKLFNYLKLINLIYCRSLGGLKEVYEGKFCGHIIFP